MGAWLGGDNVTEVDLDKKKQALDMYNGIIVFRFEWNGELVLVSTVGDLETSTIAVEVASPFLMNGALGIFFDYPYNRREQVRSSIRRSVECYYEPCYGAYTTGRPTSPDSA